LLDCFNFQSKLPRDYKATADAPFLTAALIVALIVLIIVRPEEKKLQNSTNPRNCTKLFGAPFYFSLSGGYSPIFLKVGLWKGMFHIAKIKIWKHFLSMRRLHR
jgi:hypothetical protein